MSIPLRNFDDSFVPACFRLPEISVLQYFLPPDVSFVVSSPESEVLRNKQCRVVKLIRYLSLFALLTQLQNTQSSYTESEQVEDGI